MSDPVKKVIRLAAVIILSAAIGIVLGQFVSNYELRFMLSREYCGSMRGIEVYRTGGVNETNMALHLNMLQSAPEQLTECVDRIYFTGSDLDLPVHDDGLGPALGLTQGRTVFISTESFSSYVVLHEMFHAYDNSHGELSSYSETFKRIYEKEARTVPVFAAYIGAYPAEFFAQAGAMCITMPNEMSLVAPETYAYFSELLKIG